MVGDRWRDIAAEGAAGCKTVFIDHRYDETRTVPAAIRSAFGIVSVTGRSRVAKRQPGLDIIEATNGLARARYLVAIPSDPSLPDTPSSVYLERVHDVIEQSHRLPVMEAQLRELTDERDFFGLKQRVPARV